MARNNRKPNFDLDVFCGILRMVKMDILKMWHFREAAKRMRQDQIDRQVKEKRERDARERERREKEEAQLLENREKELAEEKIMERLKKGGW